MHIGFSANQSRLSLAAGLCFLLLAGAFILSSCTSSRDVVDFPQIEGAAFVGNKACQECHLPIARQWPGSVHSRVRFDHQNLPGGTGCESCHGPGSRHVQSGGARGLFIVNPGRDPASCFRCHLDVHAEFSLPQHHPVIEGRLNCVQCHDPHGGDIFKTKCGLAMARMNETCAQCHREQTRPVTFEHPALREGCIACHQPHGAINSKLLVAPDANLCLRCHAQSQAGGTGELFIGSTPHAALLRQGNCWSAGCHTAVHGSNVNPHLLY